MTTGSRGLHILVPLKRNYDFNYVREFARDVALVICSRDPEHLTLDMQKKKRGMKIFVDYLRNAYSATAVAPYAVRALPKAPIATPLHWDEVANKKLHSQQYTLRTIETRLHAMGDPWHDVQQYACSLKKARKALDALLQER